MIEKFLSYTLSSIIRDAIDELPVILPLKIYDDIIDGILPVLSGLELHITVGIQNVTCNNPLISTVGKRVPLGTVVELADHL